MRDINDFMPKIPNMRWGALMNYHPENSEIRKINKLMPNDKKWHTILKDENQVSVDGKDIRNRTPESMT